MVVSSLGWGRASAFAESGFRVAWATDIDKAACATFAHRFPGVKPLEGDVRDLHVDPDGLTPVDVLTAGFPCQSFSPAGNKRGFDDERGESSALAVVDVSLSAAADRRANPDSAVPVLIRTAAFFCVSSRRRLSGSVRRRLGPVRRWAAREPSERAGPRFGPVPNFLPVAGEA